MNMKHSVFKFFLFSILTISLYSCDSTNSQDKVKIFRLDEYLGKYMTMNHSEREINDSLMSSGIEALTYMLNFGHPDDSAFIKYANSKAVIMFTPDVHKQFPNLNEEEATLSAIKQNLRNELPDIKLYNIFSIVSPYNQSIFIADTTMLLALNHYLGPEHDAYSNFYDYQKLTKDSKFIIYDITEALIATSYPYIRNSEETILNKMLYEGALIEAKMRLIPNASLALALGYSNEQLEWLEENNQQAWDTFISQGLLYSKSLMDFERIFNPSPSTSIIHTESPGRIGRFFGYKIIKSYIQNNKFCNLKQLLSPEFYNSQQSFISANYQANN